ncbi:chitin synthesis regulation, resistance to congo red-domain-containing protein [Podospora aff. communis PSN243]|uniref:Chitin synthesis regulation, resistance to congo red-domain-containing protein n=1 Tax=Podospora aff. communis PSN243 TaxID=3040156 RepID=A0AAV9H1U8_9PEZI|nr:chitin synthesis regulation, resistance to congo red-domain-containing protein [Podospora aff. communis PSN243]
MAPFEQTAPAVDKRELYCPSGYYLSGTRCYPNNSGWYWWGRWVFAGLLVLFVIALLLLLARNSRRRRRQGLAPLRGTGWMAGPPPPYYPPPPQYGAGAPPPGPVYPQGTGQKFNQNDGYYAQNQEGVHLQQPQQTYQPPNNYPSPSGYPHNGEPVYSPPEGPPPTRK